MPALENRVGPYRIVRLIKGGGQGRVYLGYDSRLHRQVAIKIHDLPASRASRRLALAEARRASRINCPQVVQIFDIIESSGHLAMVMEYVPGCDLEQLLQHRVLSVASVLTVGLDLAAALAIARQQKVVHGDLKAANVLITRQGRAKLTDFGIAREITAEGLPHRGSESALAPEHLTGAGLDLRSDLFALGCLLYRMLYAEHPFIRQGRLDSRRLLAGPGPVLQNHTATGERLPEGLSSLVEQLLQRNPGDRPANTHPVRGQLRQFRQQLPIAEVECLQREAESAFRPESPEDLPLNIPAGLRDGGRSRIKRSVGGRTLRQLRGLRPSTRFTLAATLAVVIGVPIALAMQDNPTRIHFDPPGLALADNSVLPPEIDELWLMEEVYRAAEAVIGPLHASGSVRPRAYYATLAEAAPEIVLKTSLRCDEVLCLFTVSRGVGESFAYRQVVISPQMPVPVWRDLITSNTRSLLD
ncbi:serine/threonine protein kinase [Seongchinamella unica]|uniref:Serine/threonine protein kinase n=1 Tax=Seongchinamella unica TaxID=2547392 RepID=A0A4R5LUH6_9GAMM|nr:serine/threonine-protein kinase [Seongchinamella unica]TDG15054.1 serine/threonine protein kinase [Seongchinamella unica]